MSLGSFWHMKAYLNKGGSNISNNFHIMYVFSTLPPGGFHSHVSTDVNRGTIYLHYMDKYDLLDKMIDEHINNLWETTERVCEMEWVDATKTYFEYFESNYLFFSTMLASKAAPSFRRKFLEFLIEAFKDEVDKTKNHSLNADIIVKFAANAYVGVLESWLKEGMPYPPYVMAKEMGILLERIVDAHKFYMRQGFTESPKYFIKMLPKSD